jgi:hypothetical protein
MGVCSVLPFALHSAWKNMDDVGKKPVVTTFWTKPRKKPEKNSISGKQK